MKSIENASLPQVSQGERPITSISRRVIAPQLISAHTSDALKHDTVSRQSAAQKSAAATTPQPIADRSAVEKTAARRNFWIDVTIRAAFVAFLIVLWHVTHYYFVTKTESWSRALFPSPSQVGRWLWDGFGFSYFSGDYDKVPGHDMPKSFLEAVWQKEYLRAIGASIYRLVWGYAIAVVIGFPLGLLVARFSLAEKTIGWLSISLQSLPSICWIPLAILWFGRFGATPILFVTVMGALFATVISVADGIRNVPPLLARAGRTLGADGARLYFSVLLPAALPGIVTGLKIGWSFAWRSLMAAELIVNAGGLGFLLQRDREFGNAEGVLATILVIIVIGLGVQALVFAPTERRLQNLWGLSGVRS